MGFSSFWHSLTGHKVKEMAAPKHHNKSHNQGQRNNEHNTHPSLKQNNASWDEHDQYPESESKRAKRRNVWRQSEQSTMEQPILATTNKKAKRRSFWRSDPQQPEFRMYTITTPGVPAVPEEHQATPSDVEQKKKNRQSVTSMTNVKSNKSRRNRLSFFGGGVDDDDSDDDVPALPALPTTGHTALPKSLPYQRRRDMGNNMGMGSSDEHLDDLGTARTSDQVHTTALPSMDKQNRLSKRLSIRLAPDRRESTVSQMSSKSGKTKRRSWLLSSNSDNSDAVPPVPALGFDSMPSPNTNSTFDSEFERFLVTAHKNAPGSNKIVPTDFEQFMQESAEYDAAKSNHFASRGTDFLVPCPVSAISSADRRGSCPERRGSYAGPRNAARGFRMSTTQVPAEIRHKWRHSQHESSITPAKAHESGIIMSEDQQKDWENLKELMDIAERKEEEGVVGMLRQFEEDEDKVWTGERDRGRERDSRAVYENSDALVALELRVAS